MTVPASRLAIVKALIVRDLMARYGRNNLGFFWAVMEPIILAVGVVIIWSLEVGVSLHGVQVTTFVITAYLPLTLSRHLIGPLSRLGRNSANLFFHRPVSYSYLLISRIMVEVMSSTFALCLIYFVTTSLHIIGPIQDWPLTLAGWLFTGWLYGGIALLACAWTEYWEAAEKFVTPFQYLAMPLSAVFFLVDWVPSWAQHLLLLNPAVHCYEMFRAGFFGPSVTTHYDPWYIAAWASGLTLAGIGVTYRARDHIFD